MTCDEFRKFGNTVGSLTPMTRAERVAMTDHWTSCKPCRKYTKAKSKQELRLATPAQKKAMIANARRLCNEDFFSNDPEIS
jgi:hypothetical protein